MGPCSNNVFGHTVLQSLRVPGWRDPPPAGWRKKLLNDTANIVIQHRLDVHGYRRLNSKVEDLK